MACAHCQGPFVGTPVTDGQSDPICQACAEQARRNLTETHARTADSIFAPDDGCKWCRNNGMRPDGCPECGKK